MQKNTLFALLSSIVLTLIILWQIPLSGKLPFPGHLLVGRFFPWNHQQWQGYPAGVPYKEFFAADTIRQTYPWRQLAIDQLKQGQIPWWNPFSFTGNPLLANLQSAPFYPLNFIYWLFSFDIAWTIQVLLQPILAITFTYLFARSLKLSPLASLFAGTVFAFSGYMTIWLELNTVGHAALWLPLALYLINLGLKHPRYYLLLTIPLTSSFFAGHLQSSLYLTIASAVYLIFTHFHHRHQLKHKKLHLVFPLIALLISAAIFSTQLIPALKLYRLSPRLGADSDIFSRFLMPPSHLATFLAPNFFGNPARNNFWGQDYGEFMAYFGLIPFILFVASFFQPKKTPHQKFFQALAFISFVLMLKNPIAYLPKILNTPILASSAAARILFLLQFSAAILAAYAIDHIRKSQKLFKKSLVLITPIIITFIIFAIANWQLNPDLVAQAQYKVTFRNLAIPFGLLLSALITHIVFKRRFASVKHLPTTLFLLTVLDLSYFTNAYLPFSELEFFFPSTPAFTYIQNQNDYGRFFGDHTASITSNVWMPYGLYSPEGYDSLYLSRYGQLIHSAAIKGQLPTDFPRSDADLPENQDDFYRQRLQDLMGVKYILHQIVPVPEPMQPDIGKFPTDRYQIIWEKDSYQIYQNLHASPRAFLVPDYQVKNTDQAILDLIYSPDWNPRQSVILESQPDLPFDLPDTPDTATGSAQIISYTPNRIEISVDSNQPQFLFLSDNYYPDWQAYIKESNQKLPIYRTNYAFRSVFVPHGYHTIVFVYQPSYSLN